MFGGRRRRANKGHWGGVASEETASARARQTELQAEGVTSCVKCYGGVIEAKSWAVESSLVPLTRAGSEERGESQLLHLRNGTIRLLTPEGDSGNQ